MHDLRSNTCIRTGLDITVIFEVAEILSCVVWFLVVAETLLFCISNILKMNSL